MSVGRGQPLEFPTNDVDDAQFDSAIGPWTIAAMALVLVIMLAVFFLNGQISPGT